MVRSPKTSSMINLLWAKDPKRTPSLDIKIFASATWRLWTSIQRSGRILQQTATAGAVCSRRCWRQVRRRSWSWTWQKEESQAEGTQTRQTPPPPSQATTSALWAAETVTPALVLPDTDNAVLVTTPRPPRPQYPWSTSTEGGLLRDTLKTKQKRLRAQWNRSLFLLEFSCV